MHNMKVFLHIYILIQSDLVDLVNMVKPRTAYPNHPLKIWVSFKTPEEVFGTFIPIISLYTLRYPYV